MWHWTCCHGPMVTNNAVCMLVQVIKLFGKGSTLSLYWRCRGHQQFSRQWAL